MRILISVFVLSILCFNPNHLSAFTSRNSNDAILVTSGKGEVVYQQKIDTRMIPASVLKVLTSLCAIHYLGEDYRFKTEFYIRNNRDLLIKGYGDPLLVSETIRDAVSELKNQLPPGQVFRNIILDNTFFAETSAPGAEAFSAEPYDSELGALCVNFNTVNYYTSGGILKSAEEQTPLLPFVTKRIKETGLKSGRILLTRNELTHYPGHLFRFFMNKEGIKITGKILTGKKEAASDRLVYSLVSPYTLAEMIEKLLEYSNNFIANQLFLHIGATLYGEPATFNKSIKALTQYTDLLSQKDKRISDFRIVEGSGLSRKNRISASALDAVLQEFYPYRNLMKKGKNDLYKTGTLNGISTRIGYLDINNRQYRYVVLCNKKGHYSESILKSIKKALRTKSPSP